MVASLAMIGYGSLFQIESADSPGNSPITYVALAEVKNITPPNQQVAQVDVTHNTSPNRRREFISGVINPGDTVFEMNFVPNSASELRLAGLLTSGLTVNCRITWPNATNWDFQAFVKGIEIKAATENAITATITMQVSGSYVVN